MSYINYSYLHHARPILEASKGGLPSVPRVVLTVKINEANTTHSRQADCHLQLRCDAMSFGGLPLLRPPWCVFFCVCCYLVISFSLFLFVVFFFRHFFPVPYFLFSTSLISSTSLLLLNSNKIFPIQLMLLTALLLVTCYAFCKGLYGPSSLGVTAPLSLHHWGFV